MPNRIQGRTVRVALMAALPLIATLGGCAETTIASSSNPSRDRSRDWQDFDTLPVTILGDVPDHSHAEVASLFPAAPNGQVDGGRHVVLYVNAKHLPAKNALCSDAATFQPGIQSGSAAAVTGALCDGRREVTRASGTVVTAGQSARWLRSGFDVVRSQLFQSLTRGANDPDATFRN